MKGRLFLVFLLAALLLVEALLLLRLPDIPPRSNDFLAYWSCGRLLLQGGSPYDQEALLAIEREQGWGGVAPLVCWNPPHLHLLFLPLAVLPFNLAATIWIVLCPVFIGMAGMLTGLALAPRSRGRGAGLALILAFGFAHVWHAILDGQVNIVVFLSLAAFIFLMSRNRDWEAGASLAVATVKPHLLYLLLPLLSLDLIRLRRWRVLLGFLFTMAALLSLATWLNPRWPTAYLSLLADSALSPWSYLYRTPTFHGLGLVYRGVRLGRVLWLFVLPLMLFINLYRKKPDLMVTTSWSLLIGLPTVPFSWSTDQILLLIPLLQICFWVVTMDRGSKVLVTLCLIFLYLYAFGVWLLYYQEPLFLVVPLVIGFLFWYVHHRGGYVVVKGGDNCFSSS